jgi:hypothetical protein
MHWKDILKLDMEEEFEETEDSGAFNIDPRIEAHREAKTKRGTKYKRRAEKEDPSLAEPYSSYRGAPRAYGRLNSVETRKLRRKRRLNEPVYIDTDKDGRQRVRN